MANQRSKSKVQLSAWIERSLKKKLVAIAKAENVPFSDVVIRMLTEQAAAHQESKPHAVTHEPSSEQVADAVADHMFKRNIAKVVSSRAPDDAEPEYTSGKPEAPSNPESGGAQAPRHPTPSNQTKTFGRPSSRKGKARPGSKP